MRENRAFNTFSDALLASAKQMGDTYADGLKARAAAQFLEHILGRVFDPKVRQTVMAMALTASQSIMQARQFDDKAAMEPAAYIVKAAGAIQRAGATARKAAGASPRRTFGGWFRPGLFWWRQKMELNRHIDRLENMLDAAARECDFAGSQILQQNNLLVALLSAAMVGAPSSPSSPSSSPTPALDDQDAECPLPLPRGRYRNSKSQVIAIRYLLGEFADYLDAMAAMSIAEIDRSRSADHMEVSAITVQSEGVSLAQMVVQALATCHGLKQQLNEAPDVSGGRQPRDKRQRKQDDQTGQMRATPQPADGQSRPAPAA